MRRASARRIGCFAGRRLRAAFAFAAFGAARHRDEK